MDNLKIKLLASIFFFVSLICFDLFFASGLNNFAKALTGDYSKTLPASLTLTDWNNLDDDFVAKSGDSMTGTLDMGGNRITNLNDPVNDSDAANKAYVDAQMASLGVSGAGAVYINWGKDSCPGSATLLYNGFAFNASSGNTGGSDNYLCLNDSGLAGDGFTGTYADEMYPIVTGTSGNLPSGITANRIVKCAVCRQAGTCYESYGAWACNSSAGFSSAYEGYVLGASSASTASNSGERACVNKNFDSSVSVAGAEPPETFWNGSIIDQDYSLGYTEDAFIKCSICCN